MATEAVAMPAHADSGSGPRWLLAIAGVLWILVALVVLSADATSAATIGIMVGIVLIFAGVGELVTVTVVDGWKWLHVVLGVLFIAGGIASFLDPFQTFGILAVLIGWYLLIKGFFGIFFTIALHRELPLWGLVLAISIGEMLLGAWALGYPGRSAALLVLWVGLGAMLRGVGELIAAFVHEGDPA